MARLLCTGGLTCAVEPYTTENRAAHGPWGPSKEERDRSEREQRDRERREREAQDAAAVAAAGARLVEVRGNHALIVHGGQRRWVPIREIEMQEMK